MVKTPLRAAHFLLSWDLTNSPPNEAIVHTLLGQGYDVDLYAPGQCPGETPYGPGVTTHTAEYGRRWLLKNAWSPRWQRYAVFSGTSEDPLAIVGVLALLHRRPSFALVDEIMSGSYRGDRPASWKRLCQWAMRRANFCIVNDASRADLLRDYARLPRNKAVIVYPGCFHTPPSPAPKSELRTAWGVPPAAVLIGASGGFNITNGARWLIEALENDPSLHAVIQPLGTDPLAKYLLRHLQCSDRVYVEERRLSWKEAWTSAAAFDIGLAVYHNDAPQFQNMGISSNRLCMFLAMGVPVIASRQPSFQFLEDYECGVLVDSSEEFRLAVDRIRRNLDAMKANARRCAEQYIDAEKKLANLSLSIHNLTA